MKLAFGDSHLISVKRFAAAHAPEFRIAHSHGQNFLQVEVTRSPEHVQIYSHRVPDKAAVDFTFAKDDQVVLSAPLHSSVVARHRMWRHHVPWELAAQYPQSRPVSSGFFDMLVETRTRSLLDFLEQAQMIGVRIAVLEPPLLSRRSIARSGLDADLIAAIDKIYRTCMRARLAALKVPVIDTPRQTHDGDFMLADFQAFHDNDMHHGNKHYAALAYDSLRAFFDADIHERADHAG